MAMKIDVTYGKDLDDDMLQQLHYMEADANACYENIDADDGLIFGGFLSDTLRQFKRRIAATMFLTKSIRTKSGRKIVGMACLSKCKKNVQYLHTVFVDESYRGKGIGEAIVRKALAVAKKMKCSISLGVNPLNYKAKNLYEKLGFKVCKGQKIEMHALEKKNGKSR